jgi:hypothetical protein
MLVEVSVGWLGPVEAKSGVFTVAVCEATSTVSGMASSGVTLMGVGLIHPGVGGSRVMRMAEGGQLLVVHSSDSVGRVEKVTVVLTSCTLALR